MLRRLLGLIGLLTAMAMVIPDAPAHADLISCPYPGVGHRVHVDVIASGEGFYCDDPIEVNGAHMHCQEGGGGIGFSGGTSGPGILGTSSTHGFGNFQIGANVWDCGWVCPARPGDENILWATIGPPAAQPNPPGAWKDKLKPAKCTVYERNGPVDDNSLPPAGLNPFYEDDSPPPTGPSGPPPPNNNNNNGQGQSGVVLAPVPPNGESLTPTGQ